MISRVDSLRQLDTKTARLAEMIYVKLATSPEVDKRLDDGENPEELHAQIARRSIAAAAEFREALVVTQP